MENKKEDRTSIGVSVTITLLAQSIVLFVIVAQSCYFLFNLGPTDIDISSALLLLLIVSCTPLGLLTFGLAYTVYSGTERMKILRQWAGLCICYGLFFVLIGIKLLLESLYSFYLIWFPSVNILLSLVPAYTILKFTGLSDEKREYHH